MRVTTINIVNMAGFEQFSTALSGVSVIEGPHGAGKSSIERVVMYMLGRRPLAEPGSKSVQHDPKMLRSGAESGEAIVTFSEDSDVELLRCRIWDDGTARGTDRKIKMRGKRSWDDAGRFIDDVTNALAYDPMKFKELTEKERLEAFLRVVPVDISQAEVIEAVGGAIAVRLSDKPRLEDINSIYEDIYKARKEENQQADTKTKYADQLVQALPPPAPGEEWGAEVKRLQVEKSTLEGSEREEMTRIDRELAAKVATNSVARESAEDNCRAEAEIKIAGIQTQIDALVAQQVAIRQSMADFRFEQAQTEVQKNAAATKTAE
jgi:hypothetical protein